MKKYLRINFEVGDDFASVAMWGAYKQMMYRCYNENHVKYPSYGGRGITVCDAWRNSFKQFRHDMGPKPTPEHSLDRIDNDGNYEPTNCRWATRSEQQTNKRPFNRIYKKYHDHPTTERI